MKKGLKITLIILVVVIVLAAVAGGYLIVKHNNQYISQDEAITIAVQELQNENESEEMPLLPTDIDADFEKNGDMAYYEVEFDCNGKEYTYIIDAVSGKILNSFSKID